jgi:regulator of sigma E protease
VSYLYTALGFMALIVLHEAGHFAAAKATGMRVERFSLFFGQPLISMRRSETEYGIGWLPAGGYVKITGMNPHEQLAEEQELEALEAMLRGPPQGGQQPPSSETASRIAELRARIAEIRRRAYYNQPVWKRIVVILAGPCVNLLIAFAVLFAIFSTHPIYPISTTVGALELGQPASRYLRPGDRIVAVDGRRHPSYREVERLVDQHRCAGPQVNGCLAARPVAITVRRDGRLERFAIRPRYDAQVGRMLLGFVFAQSAKQLSTAGAASYSASEMWSVTTRTVSAIARIFEPKERRQLHSVVGVVAITSQEFSFSAADAFFTLALISLALAIVNLFPFLPLDGGHVFWALAEKLRGRRISFQTMERAGIVGFALIILLFAVGVSNDISTLTSGGFNIR